MRTKRHFRGGEPVALSVLVARDGSYTLLLVAGDGLGKVEDLPTREAGEETEAQLLKRQQHRCTGECIDWTDLKGAY